ncbi:PAS domain-containing protein [Methylobacterium sp. NEAU K]|uniref:PAS domain-containing protein n=1 Tax=Methylobacterium sp. NEAU K TaxID=3064946 RepID=UPI0027350620|nr:PAS domain-containing protein [Methylobacterium sp. NEAU K]MDP4005874.1 PAS domain-containing protein [Methylobacterium sp. NEAU K]
MIFMTDASGALTYVSPEWRGLTGQDRLEAVGKGWFERLHAEDGAVLRAVIKEAAQAQAEFMVRLRLSREGGAPIWAAAGAVPSYGPPDHTFLGFLGSITEIAPDAAETPQAQGSVGRFVPPPPRSSTTPASTLDLVADHLLIAHSLIELDGGKAALAPLREALFRIGQAIAQKMAVVPTEPKGEDGESVH